LPIGVPVGGLTPPGQNMYESNVVPIMALIVVPIGQLHRAKLSSLQYQAYVGA